MWCGNVNLGEKFMELIESDEVVLRLMRHVDTIIEGNLLICEIKSLI